MEVQLKGHKNRRLRALPAWMKMKKMYDEGKSVREIVQKVKKSDGTEYAESYVYIVFKKLKTM